MPDWLTYAQASERFSVSAEAVRLRARRLGWRTQPGNDGRTLVLVPDDADVQPRPRPAEQPPGHDAVQAALQRERADQAENTADLERLRADQAEKRAESERDRADRAETRAATAEADRRATEGRADAADADRRAERARAEAAEGRAHRAEERANVLRTRLDTAEQAQHAARDAAGAQIAAIAQAEAERAARSRWRRLREALRRR
jgi:hypothetical protein